MTVTTNVIPFRARVAEVNKVERRSVRKLSKRIAARQSIGDDWDEKASNDNFAWPLAKALLAEKNHDLLKWAVKYRQIEASASSGAELRGSSQSPEDMMAIDQATWLRPDGTMAYKGERKLTAIQFCGENGVQAVRTDPNSRVRSKPVPKEWKGDAGVNDMIDNRDVLVRLRGALGPIVEPFEMAVCAGATMEQVGRSIGVGNEKQATGAGKALVILGLVTVRDALDSKRENRIAA